MLAPNSSYSISSLAALREVNALTSPMSKTQAESVLASLVAKGWLLKSKCVPTPRIMPQMITAADIAPLQKGSLFPVPTCLTGTPTVPQVHIPRRGPRLYHLLRGALALHAFKRRTLLTLIFFFFFIFSFQILTRGHACPRGNCRVRMHSACYEAYRRSNGKCPACNEDWGRVGNDRVVPVGEAAAPKDDWPRRTRRSATTESDKDAEGEEEEEAADVPVPDRAETSQAPARRNQPRAASAAGFVSPSSIGVRSIRPAVERS
jgi:hypothetical protein